MARPHRLSPGRPPDLTPPSTVPDSFNFVVRGSCYVDGTDRKALNRYRALEQLIADEFSTALVIVRFDPSGRRLNRRNTRLPSAGVADLEHVVKAHPGQNIHFYSNALFNVARGGWTDADIEVAYRRTRSLVTLAIRDFVIERRFAVDASGTAVYFEVGTAPSSWPKTRADARHEHLISSVNNLKPPLDRS